VPLNLLFNKRFYHLQGYAIVVLLTLFKDLSTNTEVFFAQFTTSREKQILAGAIGIQKENCG